MKLLPACTLPVIAAATTLLAVPILAQEQPSSANPSVQKPTEQKPTVKKLSIQPKKLSKPVYIALPNGITLLTFKRDPSDPAVIAEHEQEKEAVTTLSLGKEAFRSGQYSKAIQAFRKAMRFEPEYFIALQPLAEAYAADGQLGPAISAYRALIYPRPGQDWTTSNQVSPTVLMNYSLVLLQAGQEQEALAMYNRAVPLLNYDHGKQRASVSVLLPGIGQDGLPYNSQLLQAMARLGAGISTSGFDGKQIQEAARLAPDSPVTNFYLGEYLSVSRQEGAKEALEKAALLGDEQTKKEAQDCLKLCR